ncbi:MAG TPA: hypothetical protein VI072_34660 [Polyangiaceae bacterium]
MTQLVDFCALPRVLSTTFSIDTLKQDPSTIVAIDPRGTMLWMNDAWRRFAESNGGSSVLDRFDVGRSYFDGISGSLRDYYEERFRVALRHGEVFQLEYECSSPDVYRLMHLRALPVGQSALLLQHSMVAEGLHARASQPEIEATYRAANGLIVQCSNCRRFRRADGDTWDWVRGWVASLPKDTSHGLCSTCADFYYGQYLRSAR